MDIWFSVLFSTTPELLLPLSSALRCSLQPGLILSESTAPHGASLKKKTAKYLVYGQAVLYILSNLFIFVVSWFPASLQNTLHTKARVLPSFLGPLATMCCFAVGVLMWVWDLYIAPEFGYKVEVLQERREGLHVHMTFRRHITGLSYKIIKTLRLKRLLKSSNTEKSTGDDKA